MLKKQFCHLPYHSITTELILVWQLKAVLRRNCHKLPSMSMLMCSFVSCIWCCILLELSPFYFLVVISRVWRNRTDKRDPNKLDANNRISTSEWLWGTCWMKLWVLWHANLYTCTIPNMGWQWGRKDFWWSVVRVWYQISPWTTRKKTFMHVLWIYL